MGLIPGSGRSPGEGNGNPLQYLLLENSMDRGTGQGTVHGIQRVRHDYATHFYLQLEKGMATHSSILAWKIPKRVGHKSD